MAEFVIGFLLFGLLASNIYWARVHYQLINRIMAKDYSEFKAYEHKPKVHKVKIEDDAVDIYAEKQAHELNALIGVG